MDTISEDPGNKIIDFNELVYDESIIISYVPGRYLSFVRQEHDGTYSLYGIGTSSSLYRWSDTERRPTIIDLMERDHKYLQIHHERENNYANNDSTFYVVYTMQELDSLLSIITGFLGIEEFRKAATEHLNKILNSIYQEVTT